MVSDLDTGKYAYFDISGLAGSSTIRLEVINTLYSPCIGERTFPNAHVSGIFIDKCYYCGDGIVKNGEQCDDDTLQPAARMTVPLYPLDADLQEAVLTQTATGTILLSKAKGSATVPESCQQGLTALSSAVRQAPILPCLPSQQASGRTISKKAPPVISPSTAERRAPLEVPK